MRLRPIAHEDRLSIIDHLDELRTRLFVCLGVLIVAFGICFWQNGPLLTALNRALPHEASVSGSGSLGSLANHSVGVRHGLIEMEKGAAALAASSLLPPQLRGAAQQMAQGAHQAAKALPKSVPKQEKPITIGPAEAFTTTLAVAAYFALLLTLPVIIYQGYAFVIPALTPGERRVAMPAVALAPLLFLGGAFFAYWLVLPPAMHFLQGYNSSHFQVLIQAKSYYTFEIFVMLGIGLAFQLPLGLLALQQLGVINSRTLIHQWRYAVIIIAVIAAALPGPDPVTTGLETLPLVVLYLASIVVLKIADRRAAARAAAELTTAVGSEAGT
jgi:sec-independent protein translocase protein TatC